MNINSFGKTVLLIILYSGAAYCDDNIYFSNQAQQNVYQTKINSRINSPQIEQQYPVSNQFSASRIQEYSSNIGNSNGPISFPTDSPLPKPAFRPFNQNQVINQQSNDQIPANTNSNNDEPNYNRATRTPEYLRFINAFAWKLFRESKQVNPESNFVLSPLSVHVLLALIAPTAEGETREQFYEIIRNSDSKIVANAAREMTITRSRNELQIATAIIPSDTFRLNSTFIDSARKSYVSIIPVDFNNPNGAIEKVNSWISQATNNQINQLTDSIGLNGVKLLLSNAIYFRGFWSTTFNETENGVFYPSSNVRTQRPVTFMKMIRILSYGVKTLKNGIKYKWVELPYEKDEFSMLLVLPHDRWGLENLVRSMSLDDFEDLTDNIDSYHKRRVHLKLPKFAIKSTFSLKNTLIKLGLSDPFTSLSNIRYMAENDVVRIDDAVQQAILTVDEKGSVASAVTTFSVIALSSDSGVIDDVDFHIDQPFLSVIVDKKQTLPLFISKIYAP